MIQTSKHQALWTQNQGLSETHTWKHLNEKRTFCRNHRWIVYLLPVPHRPLFPCPFSVQESFCAWGTFLASDNSPSYSLGRTFSLMHILCIVYTNRPHRPYPWPLPMSEQNTHSEKQGFFKHVSSALTGERNAEGRTRPEGQIRKPRNPWPVAEYQPFHPILHSYRVFSLSLIMFPKTLVFFKFFILKIHFKRWHGKNIVASAHL